MPFLKINTTLEFYSVSILITTITIVIAIFSFEFSIIQLAEKDTEPDINSELLGVNHKSTLELLKYYSNEKPMIMDINGKKVEIPVTVIHEFKKGIELRNITAVKSGEVYRIPEELLGFRIKSTRILQSVKGIEFKPYDKISLLNRLKVDAENRMVLSLYEGRLADEYATIQNPDNTFTEKGEFRNKTIREFLNHDGKFPDANDNFDRHVHSIPYRVAMHVVIELRDGNIVLQKRSSRRVATSKGEITSSAGGGMDWKDLRHGAKKSISRFILREIREEISIKEKEIESLKVYAVIREMRRLGQPMIIIVGKSKLSYPELFKRWEQASRYAGNYWFYPYWYMYTTIHRKIGREFWEMESPIALKREEIASILLDDDLQPPTKVALYYLQRDFEPQGSL
jgi:hypothetical protein